MLPPQLPPADSSRRMIPELFRLVVNLLRDDGGGEKGVQWNHTYWEPIKISVGALFALVLKAGFDNTGAFLRAHPTDIYRVPSWHDVHVQVTVVVELLTLLVWASMSFFTNVRWYFQIPAEPAWQRYVGFGALVVNFGLFYFFAGSIGPVSHEQILIVMGLLLADILVTNIGLRPVLSTTYVRIRTLRRSLEMLVGVAGLTILPKGDYLVFGFFALIMLQAVAFENRVRIPQPPTDVKSDPLPAEVGNGDAAPVNPLSE